MGVLKFGGPRAQWDSMDSVTAFCFCCVSVGSNSCFAVCFGPRVASDVVEGLPRAVLVRWHVWAQQRLTRELSSAGYFPHFVQY